MAKLFLLRHLKSQWNKDDRFAGWVDVPLSDEGRGQAGEIFSKLNLAELHMDSIYCNALIRCTETVLRIYEGVQNKYPIFIHEDGGKMEKWGNYASIDNNSVPVYVSEKLNERYYGAIQGLNKSETKKKFGEQLVHEWRRAYNGKPEGAESFKDTYDRVIPFFKKRIENDVKNGKDVMVVASHNSLRAIVKYLEDISNDEIINLELPFGALVKYNFEDGKYLKLQ